MKGTRVSSHFVCICSFGPTIMLESSLITANNSTLKGANVDLRLISEQNVLGTETQVGHLPRVEVAFH